MKNNAKKQIEEKQGNKIGRYYVITAGKPIEIVSMPPSTSLSTVAVWFSLSSTTY